jgi:hypothetical protein
MADLTTKSWWTKMMKGNRKMMASLTMLVSWTVWKDHNTRIFNNKYVAPPILLASIKSEFNL